MRRPPKALIERFGEPTRSGRVALAVSLVLVACSTEPQSGADLKSSVPIASHSMRFVDPPSGAGAMAPNLASGRDSVFLTWLERAGDGPGHALYLSELRGHQWTAPRQIATGDAFFANWADLPAATETADGTRFAHWLRRLGPDTYAYGAMLARSQDGGETWENLGLLHDDDSPTEHGFVSYVPLPDGGAQAFWLDGRAMPDGGGMQLRTAHLADERPKASTILDERVCECCATDAALTATGPMVVYRDRSATEIRDIAVVRATGEGWSEPAVIHDDGWQIHGCPVNGPAIATEGARVAVAWFSAGAPHARVAVAFSDDGGANFSAPMVVDDATPLGRVDVALDLEGRALVSWLGSSDEGAEIRWRRMAPDGKNGALRVAATTTAKRSAGMPRINRRGDDLLFAWVDDAEPSRIRAGLVPLR